ncbi:glycoside hydrolase family 95 protein [Vallitalea okinawensis]|uniref:glycoside hydrolase family 95 protein n=1 Tax=Vallitalea okinawensis TaxID=2078660 RepID=UPI000CFAD5C3|nr:glycoside hydrolase family 95 protein [Vallitalea okinawensis]
MRNNVNLLWYEKPADSWEKGMAIGNGWLGGMVMGGCEQEHIYLNLDTLWSGYGKDKNLYGNAHHVETARQLIKADKLEEADNFIGKQLLGDFSETYMPAGDLWIDFYKENQKEETYCRQLDLHQSLIKIERGQHHHREIFCSYPDGLIGVRLEDSELNFDLHLTSQLKHQITTQGNRITLDGLAPSYVEQRFSNNKEVAHYYDDRPGIRFALALVVDTDGVIVHRDNTLSISTASYATVYLTGDTNFKKGDDYNYLTTCHERLREKLLLPYKTIRDNHIEDYRRLYDRVSFSIGDNEEEKSCPTDALLQQFKETSHELSLIPLAFNLGRYLIISGSRENSTAMNLQGIWNKDIRPIWQSNYTVNINTQMNYWPVEMCNLSECHEPLFDLLEIIHKAGRITAKEHYDCEGWVSHHNIDLWGHTSPVGLYKPTKLVQAAFWPMSSGWLSIHLWEHYLYTEDLVFLREKAMPIMKDSVIFYLDWLTENDKGQLETIPSTSPENHYVWKDGKNVAASISTTMDIGIIRKLFKSVLEGLKILGQDPALQFKINDTLSKLRPYQIGKHGQLMEWIKDYEDMDPVHRHVSHLFALYPSDEITVEATPELAEACKVTLNQRGDDGTGWSIAWKVLYWARLKDGDKAFNLLKRYLNPITSNEVNYYNGGVYDSLLCAHPPFQIDGNCGITAAIGEMLIQSHKDYIELLPALPNSWDKGELLGIKARGNYTLDFKWKSHKITYLKVISAKKECIVKVNGKIHTFPCNQLIDLNKIA